MWFVLKPCFRFGLSSGCASRLGAFDPCNSSQTPVLIQTRFDPCSRTTFSFPPSRSIFLFYRRIHEPDASFHPVGSFCPCFACVAIAWLSLCCGFECCRSCSGFGTGAAVVAVAFAESNDHCLPVCRRYLDCAQGGRSGGAVDLDRGRIGGAVLFAGWLRDRVFGQSAWRA